jgi:hypothetical protein
MTGMGDSEHLVGTAPEVDTGGEPDAVETSPVEEDVVAAEPEPEPDDSPVEDPEFAEMLGRYMRGEIGDSPQAQQPQQPTQSPQYQQQPPQAVPPWMLQQQQQPQQYQQPPPAQPMGLPSDEEWTINPAQAAAKVTQILSASNAQQQNQVMTAVSQLWQYQRQREEFENRQRYSEHVARIAENRQKAASGLQQIQQEFFSKIPEYRQNPKVQSSINSIVSAQMQLAQKQADSGYYQGFETINDPKWRNHVMAMALVEAGVLDFSKGGINPKAQQPDGAMTERGTAPAKAVRLTNEQREYAASRGMTEAEYLKDLELYGDGA